MILSYGNYQHDEFEVIVNINNRGLENPTGYVYGWVETWTITGVLQADDLASLLVKQTLLEDAYTLQNQDVLWMSGSDIVAQIKSDDSLYGVRVVIPPSFLQGSASGELVNRRQYQISLEAAYLYDIAKLNSGDSDYPYVIDYESNLSFTGTGGTTFGHLPTLTGKYQKQILTETSLVTAQQTGKRVGLNAYPTADVPLVHLADFEKVDRRVIRFGNTRRINNNQIEYPIFWSYTFERNELFPAPKQVVVQNP